MKLAASNIAWKREDNERVADLLRKYGVTGVEVTPSTVFDSPWWREQGFEVVAMQGLLYGVEGASLWGEGQSKVIKGLKKAIHLAAAFEIPCLVFGSPTARNCSEWITQVAWNKAVEVFRALGDLLWHTHSRLLIEPLTNDSGCWFLNSTMEALGFVQVVSKCGIGVHIDATALRVTGENLTQTLKAVAELSHCHASNYHLEPMNPSDTAHHFNLSAALRQANYTGYVSLEQRDHGLEALEESLAILQRSYE